MGKWARTIIKSAISFVFFLVLLMLPGRTAGAADTAIQKEIEYQTTNEEEKRELELPETIRQDGTLYERGQITYQTVKETPVTEKITVTMQKKSNVIKDNENYLPEKTIEKDGITYTLLQTVKKKKTLEQGYVQKVTGYSSWETKTAAKNADATKSIPVKDRKTGKTVSVTCHKTGIQKTVDTWVNTYIDIVFIAYDADHFIWQNIIVKKNAKEPLKGYEKELLASVGGNESNYRVGKISWTGKSYRNKNGVLCRKARAAVRKKTAHYRVNYTGSRKVKAVKGTVYKSTYIGEKERQTGKVTYTIKASAVYRQQKKEVPVLALTVGIIFMIIMVIGILILLLKKRQKKEQNPLNKKE